MSARKKTTKAKPTRAKTPPTPPRRVVLDPKDPIACARAFENTPNNILGGAVFWQGDFYTWSGDNRGPFWRTLAMDVIRHEVWKFLEGADRVKNGSAIPFQPKMRDVNAVVWGLKMIVRNSPPDGGIGILSVSGKGSWEDY